MARRAVPSLFRMDRQWDLLTAPPPEYKTEGNVFALAAGQCLGGTDYRIWAGVLFVCTLVLWWSFR